MMEKKGVVAVSVAVLIFAVVTAFNLACLWEEQGSVGSAASSVVASEIGEAFGNSPAQREGADGTEMPLLGDDGGQDPNADVDGWKTIPVGYDPGDDEWPGASLGFVGPEWQGSLDEIEYSTNDELNEALTSLGNGVENRVPEEIAAMFGGDGCDGTVTLYFDSAMSEYDAHVLVEDLGGIWAQDDYAWGSSRSGSVMASVFFPDCVTVEELEEKAERLMGCECVNSAAVCVAVVGIPDVPSAPSASAEPRVSYTGYQNYIKVSRFDKAWTVQRCSRKATVAVLDSGFDLDHEDLSKNFLAGWDILMGAPLSVDYGDGIGHGTGVCGVISAVTGNDIGIDGCSSNALLLPVRLHSGGSFPWSRVTSALAYLELLPDKPDVVNMSFAANEKNLSEKQINEAQVKVDSLHNSGVTLVAAAGNIIEEEGETEYDLKYPAALNNVIGVGSVSPRGVKSTFSHRNGSIDICAVGESVISTANPHANNSSGIKYMTWNGTSFAAPQVSAAAALLRVQNPTWGPTVIEQQLEATAYELLQGARPDMFGAGMLDASAAVNWTNPNNEPLAPLTGGSAWEMWKEGRGLT